MIARRGEHALLVVALLDDRDASPGISGRASSAAEVLERLDQFWPRPGEASQAYAW